MRRAVVFDLDGVIVKTASSWTYLHRLFGVKGYEEHMRLYLEGKIDYKKFMELDISLWLRRKPLTINEVEEALLDVGVREEAGSAIRRLVEEGFDPLILSCGLDILARRVSMMLGVKHYLANGLEERRGLLTGRGIMRVPLLDKDKVLRSWLKVLGYEINEAVYVGDSIFDVPVFRIVGLSVAFTCNRQVGEKAVIWVKKGDLLDLAKLVINFFKT